MADNDSAPSSEPSGKSEAGNVLTRKLGPFPIWAWGVIGAAAVGVMLIIRSQQSGTTNTVGQQAAQGAGVGVTGTDPLTADELLQQMQLLSSQLPQTGGNSATPPSGSTNGVIPVAGVPGGLQVPTRIDFNGPNSPINHIIALPGIISGTAGGGKSVASLSG